MYNLIELVSTRTNALFQLIDLFCYIAKECMVDVLAYTIGKATSHVQATSEISSKLIILILVLYNIMYYSAIKTR